MTEIASFPGFSIALPMVMLFGSLLVSRVLKISKIGTILVASLALPLPFIEMPLAREFCHGHPEYLIGAAWAIMLAAAIGWVLVRPVVAGAVASLGIIKFVYLIILAGALSVTSILMVNPDLLARYAPGWRGTAGLVLLSASLLSMSLSLARVLKAALFLVVWSFVSIVLASEVFLHKLPQHIVRDDLKRIQSIMPSETLNSVLQRLDVGMTEGDANSIFVLGGSPATGFRLSEEHSFSDRLRRRLEKSGMRVVLHDASLQGSSMYDIRRAVSERIEPLRPKVVFVVGWAGDKIRGSNPRDVPAWTSAEAHAGSGLGDDGTTFSRTFNGACDAITSSKLYGYLVGSRREPGTLRPGVPAEEYREQLAQVVRSLRAAGSEVVLVSEPVVGADDKPYRDAMVEAAVIEQAVFVPADRLIARTEDPSVFSRGALLSPRGLDVVAGGAVDLLRRAAVATDGQGMGNPSA